MEQFYHPFVAIRIWIINVKQWFHIEVTDFDKRIIQSAEHIEHPVPGLVLGREETISLKEHLINIIGQMCNIENILLLINYQLFLVLVSDALSLFNERPEYLGECGLREAKLLGDLVGFNIDDGVVETRKEMGNHLNEFFSTLGIGLYYQFIAEGTNIKIKKIVTS